MSSGTTHQCKAITDESGIVHKTSPIIQLHHHLRTMKSSNFGSINNNWKHNFGMRGERNISRFFIHDKNFYDIIQLTTNNKRQTWFLGCVVETFVDPLIFKWVKRSSNEPSSNLSISKWMGDKLLLPSNQKILSL